MTTFEEVLVNFTSDILLLQETKWAQAKIPEIQKRWRGISVLLSVHREVLLTVSNSDLFHFVVFKLKLCQTRTKIAVIQAVSS